MYKKMSRIIKFMTSLFHKSDIMIGMCHSGKPSFFSSCLKCEVDDAYKGWNKDNERKFER